MASVTGIAITIVRQAPRPQATPRAALTQTVAAVGDFRARRLQQGRHARISGRDNDCRGQRYQLPRMTTDDGRITPAPAKLQYLREQCDQLLLLLIVRVTFIYKTD